MIQDLQMNSKKLKQEIKGVDAIQDPTSFNKMNSKLQQTSKGVGNVTGRIAEASAAMETDLSRRYLREIHEVSMTLQKDYCTEKGLFRTLP